MDESCRYANIALQIRDNGCSDMPSMDRHSIGKATTWWSTMILTYDSTIVLWTSLGILASYDSKCWCYIIGLFFAMMNGWNPSASRRYVCARMILPNMSIDPIPVNRFSFLIPPLRRVVIKEYIDFFRELYILPESFIAISNQLYLLLCFRDMTSSWFRYRPVDDHPCSIVSEPVDGPHHFDGTSFMRCWSVFQQNEPSWISNYRSPYQQPVLSLFCL